MLTTENLEIIPPFGIYFHSPKQRMTNAGMIGDLVV
jgi:hypothetical protein